MKYISAIKSDHIKPSIIKAVTKIISQPFFGKRNQPIYFGIKYPMKHNG